MKKAFLSPIVTFARMSWAAKKLFLYVFTLLLLIRLGMRFLPFDRLSRFTLKLGLRSPRNRYTLQGLIWAVLTSSRFTPGGAKCLARALTMQVLMQQQGYPSEICIGVSKRDRTTLEAHAWVESQGEVIMGWLPDLDRYHRLNNQNLTSDSLAIFSKFA